MTLSVLAQRDTRGAPGGGDISRAALSVTRTVRTVTRGSVGVGSRAADQRLVKLARYQQRNGHVPVASFEFGAAVFNRVEGPSPSPSLSNRNPFPVSRRSLFPSRHRKKCFSAQTAFSRMSRRSILRRSLVGCKGDLRTSLDPISAVHGWEKAKPRGRLENP